MLECRHELQTRAKAREQFQQRRTHEGAPRPALSHERNTGSMLPTTWGQPGRRWADREKKTPTPPVTVAHRNARGRAYSFGHYNKTSSARVRMVVIIPFADF